MQLDSHLEVIIKQILEEVPIKDLKRQITELHPSDIGNLLEAIPYEARADVWVILQPDVQGEALVKVHEEVKQHLIEISPKETLVNAVSLLQIDEIADLDKDLPPEVIDAIVQAMDGQTQQRYQLVKQYPDDTAGGLMDIDAVAIRSDVTIFVAMRYFRMLRTKYQINPEHLDKVYVVNKQHYYLGSVTLSDIVSLSPDTQIKDIMNIDDQPILDDTPTKNIAKIFEDKDLISAPVVNEANELLGRITIDDVVDVIRNQDEEMVMRPAGLSADTDVFSPVMSSIRYRAVWLGINLINSFIAAFTINLFSPSIEKIVALAVLMPVVASMGGVVGNQTLTLVTRGIALDQITSDNKMKLLSKELKVGLLNGLMWAVIVAIFVYIWKHNTQLSLVFSGALILSILLSAMAGTIIPLVLNKLKIDPAIAGSVILVAFSDIAGFFIFLSIATFFLLA